MGINRLINNLSKNEETSELEFGKFLPQERIDKYIKNESASEMRLIAKSIKVFHENSSSQSLDDLLKRFNLEFLSQLHESAYIFVHRRTLTKYLSENGIVNITAFSGDSWFKEIDNLDSSESKSRLRMLADFYLQLLHEEEEIKDPIKKRVITYSRFKLVEKYNLDYFEFENYHVFTLRRNAILIDKKTNQVTELEMKPVRSFLDQLFLSLSRFGLVIYVGLIVVAAAYSLQSSQIDVIAPYIDFTTYNYEIGDEFDYNEPIERLSDNIDTPSQLRVELLTPIDTSNPNVAEVEYLVKDRFNNSRVLPTQINVVDTTPPVIIDSSIPNTIEYDDYRQYDYEQLISTSDNHLISTVEYSLPYFENNISKPLGTFNASFIVTDRSGNQSSHTRVVRIIDSVAPRFDINTTNLVVNYNQRNTFNYSQNVTNVFDNYDSSQVTFRHSIQSNIVDPGTYPVTVTATDRSGNQTQRTYNARIVDSTPPSLTVIDSLTLNVNQISSFDPTSVFVSATDNHELRSIKYSSIDVLRNKIGNVNFVTTAVDESGNETKKSTTIRLVDTTRPTISILELNSIITDRIPIEPDDATILGMVSVNDNADPRPRVFWEGTMLPGRTNTITIYAIDWSKNLSEATVYVTLSDNISPTLTFIDSGLVLTESEAAASPLRSDSPTRQESQRELIKSVQDNMSSSSDIQITYLTTSYDITQVGTVVLRFRITDQAGNSSIFEYPIITVSDPPSEG
jgi:hypothetical protein